jgi:cell shape-determining protein MreC
MNDITRQIGDTQAKIAAVEDSLSHIQRLWTKSFALWSEEEKEYFGTEDGKKDKKQLMKEKEQLLKEKEQLRKEKEQLRDQQKALIDQQNLQLQLQLQQQASKNQ